MWQRRTGWPSETGTKQIHWLPWSSPMTTEEASYFDLPLLGQALREIEQTQQKDGQAVTGLIFEFRLCLRSTLSQRQRSTDGLRVQ